MGYYTTFKMGVESSKNNDASSLNQFQYDVDSEYEFGSYELQLDWLIHGDCDSLKWYDYNLDMCELSKRYPNLLLWLTGEGEESGDIWKSWYRNGKSVQVRPQMDFPIPADIDQSLPLIPEGDLERTRIEALIAELQAKLETL